MAKSPTSSTAHPHAPWESLWLYRELEARSTAGSSLHAKGIIGQVRSWMDQMNEVLMAGGTSRLDFTLHDHRHAYNVAVKMEQILKHNFEQAGVDPNLSDYELALLLLAAYGHDIGMTPERTRVEQHRAFLYGHKEQLTKQEQDEFLQFLDNYEGCPPLPLKPTENKEHLRLEDNVLTFYIRDRHNAWSLAWMKENLADHRGFRDLPNALDLLVLLCDSHHLECHKLEDRAFDPRPSGGQFPQIIHMRFLACVLRLADILENDRERTPEVLFHHRNIEERKQSLVHWIMPHCMTTVLGAQCIEFHAHPPSAVVHRALLQLADWIDYELHGITCLREKLPETYKLGTTTIDRRWCLPPAVQRHVRTDNPDYEYIDGAFRPNTARLLELLSDERLYGEPIVAVRELLQNAFDAVREKIARRRLALAENGADPSHEKTMGDQEWVKLTLRPDPAGTGWVLDCEDSGVGLTKAIIKDHLLVSGNTRRTDLRQLERDCQEKQIPYIRTGQFGIGVLSYFMLARDVEIITTRSQLCRDNDAPGWQFTTHGIGSFGELKKLPQQAFADGGTRVRWHLREEKMGKPEDFAWSLKSFLSKTLIRIPCQFQFSSEVTQEDNYSWHRSTGWTKTVDDWKEILLLQWREPFVPGPPLSDEKFARLHKFNEDSSRAYDLLGCEMKEFPLPEGEGTARVYVGYFDLPEGRACTFIDDQNVEYSSLLSQSVKDERFTILKAWKGMFCEHLYEGLFGPKPSFLVELDIKGLRWDGLKVSRAQVHYPRHVVKHWIEQTVEPWADLVLASGAKNAYQEFNLLKRDRKLTLQEGCLWKFGVSEEALRTEPIKRPFRQSLCDENNLDYGSRYYMARFRFGKRSPTPHPILFDSKGSELPEVWKGKAPLPMEKLAPVIGKNGKQNGYCRLWDGQESLQPEGCAVFPPEWGELTIFACERVYSSSLFRSGSCRIQNSRNPAIRMAGLVFTLTLSDGDFIKRFNKVSLLEESRAILAEAALRLLEKDPGKTEQITNAIHKAAVRLEPFWRNLAAESNKSMPDVGFIVAGLERQVRISPSGVLIADISRGDAPLLPPVTDPEFLVYEVDEPAKRAKKAK